MSKGGRVIGQGAYGCAYKPAMRCSGETAPRDGVSKLMVQEEADKEWNEVKALRETVDPTMKYTVYPISRCEPRREPSAAELSEENAAGKCSVRGANTLIVSPDGGMRLDKVPDGSPSAFARSVGNLYLGLVALHTYSLVHHDIKGDNVLVKGGVARYIDFGMSTNLRNMYPDTAGVARYTAKRGFPGFASSHLPPDWWFLQGDFDGGKTYTDVRMIQNAMRIHMEEYGNDAVHVHKVDDSYLVLLGEIYKWTCKNPREAAKAVDVFQLGRLCLSLDTQFPPEPRLRALWKHMMDRDPRKRPTAEQAFREYQSIVAIPPPVPLVPAAAPKMCGIPGDSV